MFLEMAFEDVLTQVSDEYLKNAKAFYAERAEAMRAQPFSASNITQMAELITVQKCVQCEMWKREDARRNK